MTIDMITFFIGLLIGYYLHFFWKLYQDKMLKQERKNPKDLGKDIEEKQKTVELLNFAIKQKKEEKYNLVKQNIYLRKENQDLIDLRKTTEELQKKASLDGMKIYIPEKERKSIETEVRRS